VKEKEKEKETDKWERVPWGRLSWMASSVVGTSEESTRKYQTVERLVF